MLKPLKPADTEQSDPRFANLDQLGSGDLLRLMNEADAQVSAAVAVEIPKIACAVDAIAAVLAKGGRLFYIGAGTSGRLGVLDASEIPPTFGVPADVVQGIIAGGPAALSRATEASEDDHQAGARDLLAAGFRAADAVIGIAASGSTPYVLGAIAKASEMGAVTCGICCNRGSALAGTVRYPMEPETGPEIVAGSTRLRAGTATKIILNMISTTVMIRLGHVYGNLMVNVQPTNRKLEDRAIRIIERAAEVSRENAEELLRLSGRNVRTAILMAKLGVERSEAGRLLAAHKGRIRDVLAQTRLAQTKNDILPRESQ
ncbi:MAG: N-acetylmuramic acid 6-phosphate etherase [Bryobacteraceae bacterium]